MLCRQYDLCGVCNGHDDCIGCDGSMNTALKYDACGVCKCVRACALRRTQ
jgi:hypothetical protein